jgi:hypothetical protein
MWYLLYFKFVKANEKKNLINIQKKNCSTKNFTNKMETYLDFNQKYKILKKDFSPQKSHTCIINWERETNCIINRERERYIK